MSDIERRVRELLSEVYTPEGVEIWLRANNRNLDGLKPAALLVLGGDSAEDVLHEAERVAGES